MLLIFSACLRDLYVLCGVLLFGCGYAALWSPWLLFQLLDNCWTASKAVQSASRISVFEAAGDALEGAAGLSQDPLDGARAVVAIGQVVVQRGEAVGLALLHCYIQCS